MHDQLTGAQIRMARAALRWSIGELAKKAGVGVSTVQTIEAAKHELPSVSDTGIAQTLEYRAAARDKALKAIRGTLTKAGVTFLDDDGKAGTGIRVRAR